MSAIKQAHTGWTLEMGSVSSAQSSVGRCRYMVWIPTLPGPLKRLNTSWPTPAKRPVRSP